MERNPISLLQEYTMSRFRTTPVYSTIYEKSGTHVNYFKMKVECNDHYAEGEGRSKKEARLNAAFKMYAKLIEKQNDTKQQSASTLVPKIFPQKVSETLNKGPSLSSTINYIGKLQEYAQIHLGSYPVYDEKNVCGPDHNPKFTVICEYGDFVEEGEGRSKKEAKVLAAKKMYYRIMESRSIAVPSTSRSLDEVKPCLDSTQDISSIPVPENNKNPTSTSVPEILSQKNLGTLNNHLLSPTTNYVGKLQEYAQIHLGSYPVYDEKNVCGPDHNPKFTVICEYGDFVEEGEGRSKKEAKVLAAKKMYYRIMESRSIAVPSTSRSLDEVKPCLDSTQDISSIPVPENNKNPTSTSVPEILSQKNLGTLNNNLLSAATSYVGKLEECAQIHLESYSVYDEKYACSLEDNSNSSVICKNGSFITEGSAKEEPKALAANKICDQIMSSKLKDNLSSLEPLNDAKPCLDSVQNISPMSGRENNHNSTSTVIPEILSQENSSTSINNPLLSTINSIEKLQECAQIHLRSCDMVYDEKNTCSSEDNSNSTVICKYGNWIEEAEGSSKKEAESLASKKMYDRAMSPKSEPDSTIFRSLDEMKPCLDLTQDISSMPVPENNKNSTSTSAVEILSQKVPGTLNKNSLLPKTNYVGKLQEYAQIHLDSCPVYDVKNVFGPDHNRKFTVICKYGNFIEEAEGSSKKEAKALAAKKIYDKIMSSTSKAKSSSLEPVNDVKRYLDSKQDISPISEHENNKNSTPASVSEIPSQNNSETSNNNPLSPTINYVGKLQEYAQTHLGSYPFYDEKSIDGPHHNRKFTVICEYGNFIVEAEGSSKKVAKTLAAKKMYDRIMSTKSDVDSCSLEPLDDVKPGLDSTQEISRLQEYLANKILLQKSIERAKEKFALLSKTALVQTPVNTSITYDEYHTVLKNSCSVEKRLSVLDKLLVIFDSNVTLDATELMKQLKLALRILSINLKERSYDFGNRYFIYNLRLETNPVISEMGQGKCAEEAKKKTIEQMAETLTIMLI